MKAEIMAYHMELRFNSNATLWNLLLRHLQDLGKFENSLRVEAI